jgi:N-acetylmuramidase
MSSFEPAVLSQIATVARTYKLDLAALLAVVEIESDGHSLEIDGKTPSFLFEKHIFYRQLLSLDRPALERAVSAGLACETWQPKTEYRNEGTSSARLAIFAQACAINDEAACRSASWGVGQTMGFNYHELGFVDARHLLDYMIAGGVPAQVDCLIREIEHNNLARYLNAHDWAHFARGYNGAGYAANAYDVKLAHAYERWLPKMHEIMLSPTVGAAVVPSPAKPQPQTPGPVIATRQEAPAPTGVVGWVRSLFT